MLFTTMIHNDVEQSDYRFQVGDREGLYILTIHLTDGKPARILARHADANEVRYPRFGYVKRDDLPAELQKWPEKYLILPDGLEWENPDEMVFMA